MNTWIHHVLWRFSTASLFSFSYYNVCSRVCLHIASSRSGQTRGQDLVGFNYSSKVNHLCSTQCIVYIPWQGILNKILNWNRILIWVDLGNFRPTYFVLFSKHRGFRTKISETRRTRPKYYRRNCPKLMIIARSLDHSPHCSIKEIRFSDSYFVSFICLFHISGGN